MAGDDRAAACVAVVCGVPAAGKTTLCRELEAAGAKLGLDGDPVTVTRLSFDDVEDELAEHCKDASTREFDNERWKKARGVAFRRIREILSDATTNNSETEGGEGEVPLQSTTAAAARRRTLLLVDDNMHYRSMRYQCFRLARASGAAYLSIFLDCEVTLALAWNAARTGREQVPRGSLERVSETLEAPGPEREFRQPVVHLKRLAGRADNATEGRGVAEAGTLTVVDRNETRTIRLNELWFRVCELWGAAPQRLLTQEERMAARQAGQAANAASLMHTVDLRCRKAISDVLSELSSLSVSGSQRAHVAAALNSARKELLEAYRAATTGASSVPHPPGGSHGGDVHSASWGRFEQLDSSFRAACDGFLCP